MRVLNTGASAIRALVSALLRLTRSNPKLLIAAGLATAVVGYASLTYASIQRASTDVEALQDQVQGISPLSLAQPATYADISDLAVRVQQSSASARRWLTPLRAFLWVPSLGPRAREGLRLLDAANSAARVARLLSNAFGSALNVPDNQSLSPETAALVVSSLRANAAQILEAHQELARLSGLLNNLGDTGVGARTRERFDQYLPFLEAVLYLGRVSPEVAGDAYVLHRALDSLRKGTEDPLKVMENPAEVRGSLETIDAQSLTLAGRLDVVLLTSAGTSDSQLALSASAREALTLIHQQLLLLNRVTKGLEALVVVAELSGDEGMLTEGFGARAKGELERAIREFQLAQQELAALQSLVSTQKLIAQDIYASLLASALGSLSASPDFLAGLLDDMDEFARALHNFLGYDGTRTYLWLGQNENEPRGAGGFLGIVVEVVIKDGVLGKLTYYDSTHLNQEPVSLNPGAPPGYYWYFYMSHMLFQDANWYPHFPTTAALLAEMFRRKTGIQVDGVLAANKGVTLSFVDLLGDLRVPGLEKPLDRATANALQEEQQDYPCRPTHSSDRPKRCFDEDLFFAILDRIQRHVSPEVRSRLAVLFQTALREKDIQMHLFESMGPASDLPWSKGWNGAVQIVDHDYLLVVDSSLGTHAVPDITRSMEYQVELRVGAPSPAHLRLRYQNKLGPTIPVCRDADLTGLSTCYFNYVRLYVSPAAQDIAAPVMALHEGMEKLAWGHLDLDTTTVIKQHGGGLTGLTEIGGYVAVEPLGQVTIPVQWSLGPSALRRVGAQVYEYRLLVQKQSGMSQSRVSVAVKLPPGAGLVSASPGASAREGGWVVLEQTLRTDLLFFVTFRAPAK